MIVLLCGRSGSGKSTIADYFSEEYTQLALADDLKLVTKDILNSCYNLSLKTEDFYDEKRKKEPINDCIFNGEILTIRKAMQHIGTNIFRKINDRIWINLLVDKIKNNLDCNLIITDIRFQNELDVIKSTFENQTKVISIKIVRDGIEKMNHESENSVDNIVCDFILYNNDTREKLFEKFKKIIEN